ncbi:MAG TPA: nuclear transport factor 2 family protein [Phenylobacterium sp.]
MSDANTLERSATTADIAKDLVALCSAGAFDAAGEKYWADSVLSLEPTEGGATRGIAQVRLKGEAWTHANEVHSVVVEGPYVHGDQFVVRFKIDQTVKATGQRMQMDEVGVYTLKDGKIVEERFFYGS